MFFFLNLYFTCILFSIKWLNVIVEGEQQKHIILKLSFSSKLNILSLPKISLLSIFLVFEEDLYQK